MRALDSDRSRLESLRLRGNDLGVFTSAALARFLGAQAARAEGGGLRELDLSENRGFGNISACSLTHGLREEGWLESIDLRGSGVEAVGRNTLQLYADRCAVRRRWQGVCGGGDNGISGVAREAGNSRKVLRIIF